MNKLAVRLLVPAAAAVLLVGCANPNGQTAFQVGGSSVSLGDIDRATDGCVNASQGKIGRAEIKTTVAQMMLAGELTRAVEDATGTKLDQSDRDKAFQQQGQGSEPLLANTDCKVAVQGFLDYQALMTKLGAPKLLDEVKKLDVEVNPRYGQWRAEKGSFTNGSGSLSSEDLGFGKVYGA